MKEKIKKLRQVSWIIILLTTILAIIISFMIVVSF